MFKALVFAIAFLVLAGAAAHGGQRRIDGQTRWLCYYGEDRRVLDVSGYDMLILEADALGDLAPEDKKGRLCIAYVSIGEAETPRWFWSDIKDKDWVLDVNPDWPESRRIDPRSGEWADLVVDDIAASLLAAGYDGFILDNVDTAEHLLSLDKERYKGADQATMGIIRRLRETYPDAIIIANGGLSIVPRVADSVDAMMYEGTVSTWRQKGDDFVYSEIPARDKTWLRPRLARVRSAGVPILALEYAAPGDEAAREKIEVAVRKAGDNPYVSQRALDTFPGSERLEPLPEE